MQATTKFSLPSIDNRLLFWCVAVALLFFRLGATTTWQSEDRWLEIAREMIDSGDYLSPTINGTVYFDKPLLGYWLQVAVAMLRGGLDEFALRAPSALAALLALWATIDLGRRLWSPASGRLAGWILLTSLGFVQWGRLGEADMENLAAAIVAVNWYWRHRDRTGFIAYATFYAILAIGAQCKGLAAVAVPLLAVCADLDKRKLRAHIDIRHAAGLIVGMAIYLLPFLLSTAENTQAAPISAAAGAIPETGLGLVLRENLVRYFAPFDHTGPIYTYLIALPQYLFPWSPVLIAALIAAVETGRRRDASSRWLLLAFLFIFAFFTLSGSRRNYYILPLLPYGALIVARFLQDDAYPQLRRWSLRVSIALLALFGALQLALVPAWPLLQRRLGADLPTELAWACGIVGACCLGSLFYLRSQRRADSPVAITAVMTSALVLWGGYFFWQQIIRDAHRSEGQFIADLKPIAAGLGAAGGDAIALYRTRPAARLLFYADLPTPTRRAQSAAELQHFLDTPPYPKLLLAPEKYRRDLPASLRERQPDLVERSYSWEKHDGDKMLMWRIDNRMARQ